MPLGADVEPGLARQGRVVLSATGLVAVESAVAGPDGGGGEDEVEIEDPHLLLRGGRARDLDVPDQQAASRAEDAAGLFEEPGLLVWRDEHEGVEAGERREGRIEEFEVGGVHDDFQEGLAGGFGEFTGAEIDGNDLLAFHLRDDAFAATTEIEDEAFGGESGDGRVLSVIAVNLIGGEAGAVRLGRGRRGEEQGEKIRARHLKMDTAGGWLEFRRIASGGRR